MTCGYAARTDSTEGAYTSVTTTDAPSSMRWRTRWRPTLPTPATPTVRPARVGLAPDLLGRGAHALEDAVRREHRAVAGAAVGDGAAGDEVALAGDVVHVLGVGPDVAGGEVAAVERLHEAAVGPQQRLGLELGRVADDDGLAAAEVEPGQRGLVGHAAREVEDVDDRVVGGGVGVEPACRRAPGRGPWSGSRRWPGGRWRGRCRRRPARARRRARRRRRRKRWLQTWGGPFLMGRAAGCAVLVDAVVGGDRVSRSA